MSTILRTASYVRTDRAPLRLINDDAMILSDPDLDLVGGERIWELLETPQTLETLCRALHVETLTDPPAGGRAVESVLVKLFERDLIEVSADS